MQVTGWQLVFIFIVAAALAWVITYGIRQLAQRHHLLAHPNERSSHTVPTPRLGGIGIVVAFMLTVLAYAWWQPAWATEHGAALSGLLLGGLLMAGLGLIDDFYTLPARLKLAGQVLIALVPILFGFRLTGIVFPTMVSQFLESSQISFGMLQIPLTLIWFVGVINLFNFMDGIDGLVAGVVVIASIFFVFLVQPLSEVAWLSVLLVALAGASLGFLRFNASPASIFMGDSGSHFLGFMLAGLSLLYAPGDSPITSFLAPIILLSALLFDAIYTLIRRLLHEENIFTAHRSHLYQRLVILGYSHRQVTQYYYFLTFITGAAALIYFYSSSSFGEWMAVLSCLAVFSASIWVINRLEKRKGETIIIRNRYYLIIDLLLIPAVAAMSFLIRIDTLTIGNYFPQLQLFIVISLIVKPVVYNIIGLYKRLWRYASIGEMVMIVNGAAVATLIVAIIIIILGTVVNIEIALQFPRSILAIDFILTVIAVGGVRFYSRLITIQTIPWSASPTINKIQNKKVLIVGAGDTGATLAREMKQSPHYRITPVGFIDDDARKLKLSIHGIPVLGKRRDIPRLVSEWGVQEVIIAMPSAPGKTIREIVQICEQAKIPFKTMPSIYELLGGVVSINQLRNIDIEDLLRRTPVHTDIAAVSELVQGKRVMVTGGGGSIGSELCRQILRCGPARLVIVGHGENSVFEIQNELFITARKLGSMREEDIHGAIADIRFPQRLGHVFETHQPEIVFHAAAHKHVPLMEFNAGEAITNNVTGTRNLLEAAVATGVEHFVMISTDKAVNPTSVMGASKRAAELLVHRAAKTHQKPYVAVRFGNVLGSRGSVIHTFRQQIAAGGPVTVTDPAMRRFFMSIPEAVQLVLQAAVLGQGGEVFMLDMGEPIKIVDMARDLIELSGFEVGRDIDIVFTGLRPGEKLFEELFVPGETYQRTRHEKIFIAGAAGIAGTLVSDNLNQKIEALQAAAERNDPAAIRQTLRRLIPEFNSQTGTPAKNNTTTALDTPRITIKN